MSAMAPQITGVSIVRSTVFSGADERKHQSSASLAFVRGIHRLPVVSHRKGPVTWIPFVWFWFHIAPGQSFRVALIIFVTNQYFADFFYFSESMLRNWYETIGCKMHSYISSV